MKISTVANNAKIAALVSLALCCIVFQSCNQSPTDIAGKWTADIKKKIIEDASRQPDKTTFDSIHHELTLFRNNKKLQQYYLAAREDQSETNKAVIYDTAMIVFFSTDQAFQWVRQPLIPKADRSYEGVAYKGNRYGLAEYNYRKDNVKEVGFHIKNLNVGTWKKYDSTGKVSDEVDNGNTDKLAQLSDMKYYR